MTNAILTLTFCDLCWYHAGSPEGRPEFNESTKQVDFPSWWVHASWRGVTLPGAESSRVLDLCDEDYQKRIAPVLEGWADILALVGVAGRPMRESAAPYLPSSDQVELATRRFKAITGTVEPAAGPPPPRPPSDPKKWRTPTLEGRDLMLFQCVIHCDDYEKPHLGSLNGHIKKWGLPGMSTTTEAYGKTCPLCGLEDTNTHHALKEHGVAGGMPASFLAAIQDPANWFVDNGKVGDYYGVVAKRRELLKNLLQTHRAQEGELTLT